MGRSKSGEFKFDGSANRNRSEGKPVRQDNKEGRDDINQITEVETWQKIGPLAQYSEFYSAFEKTLLICIFNYKEPLYEGSWKRRLPCGQGWEQPKYRDTNFKDMVL